MLSRLRLYYSIRGKVYYFNEAFWYCDFQKQLAEYFFFKNKKRIETFIDCITFSLLFASR